VIDQHLRLFPGEFMVVTGIPGHGKSTWVLNLICNMARLHDWKTALFPPEMPVAPQLLRKLFMIVGGDKSKAYDFIQKNIKFLDRPPTGDDDDVDLNVEWIIDKATEAVMRYGIRCLVVDPWNEIEHARKPNETMTEYVGRSIRALKRFAMAYNVAVIVIAHPTKDVFREGKMRPVSLYDIESSAHWYNKCDHGVVVERPNQYADEALIRICKVRFEESGERGEVKMDFDRFTSQFLTLRP
jgi:twinkle protein